MNRLHNDIEKFPSTQSIGLKNDKDYAYNNGKITEERINESVIRIIKLKNEYLKVNLK